jgi:hypothetical protein
LKGSVADAHCQQSFSAASDFAATAFFRASVPEDLDVLEDRGLDLARVADVRFAIFGLFCFLAYWSAWTQRPV